MAASKRERLRFRPALRELREETGLTPERLYNLSRVETFYRHRVDEVAFIPVFAAFVDRTPRSRLSSEHDAFEWLPFPRPASASPGPAERRALTDIEVLLGRGMRGAGGRAEDGRLNDGGMQIEQQQISATCKLFIPQSCNLKSSILQLPPLYHASPSNHPLSRRRRWTGGQRRAFRVAPGCR